MMNTREFKMTLAVLNNRQGWLFALIFKQKKPVSIIEIMALKKMKKPGGYLANDLRELVAWGFLEVNENRYHVPLWVRQCTRELLQNERLKKQMIG